MTFFFGEQNVPFWKRDYGLLIRYGKTSGGKGSGTVSRISTKIMEIQLYAHQLSALINLLTPGAIDVEIIN